MRPTGWSILPGVLFSYFAGQVPGFLQTQPVVSQDCFEYRADGFYSLAALNYFPNPGKS